MVHANEQSMPLVNLYSYEHGLEKSTLNRLSSDYLIYGYLSKNYLLNMAVLIYALTGKDDSLRLSYIQ